MEISRSKVLLFLFLILMYINPIIASKTSIFTMLIICLAVILCFYNINNKTYKVNKSFFYFFIFCSIYILTFILNSFFTLYFDSLILRITQFVTCMIIFTVGAYYKWTDSDFLLIKKVVFVFTLSYVIFWIYYGFNTNYYSAYYNHSNEFGNILLINLFFSLLPIKNNIIRHKILDKMLIITTLFLIIVSYSRSVLVSISIALLAILIISKSKNKSRIASLLLLSVVTFIVMFTLIYPKLYSTDLGFQLSQLSREYFNKNFFSGREQLWLTAFDAIIENKWTGYGVGITPHELFGFEISMHNYYLQTLIQTGIIGLSSICFILLRLFVQFKKELNQSIVRNTFAFYLAILIHECFEVSLTQNNLVTGMFYWFIFGIGFNYACNVNFGKDSQSKNADPG